MNRISAPLSNVKPDYAQPTAMQSIRRFMRLPACRPANRYGVLCHRAITDFDAVTQARVWAGICRQISKNTSV